ncbi:uncharacterized protein LOC113495624 isoform X2 [Trichoplusia ni]|uniref:Uncharacterized protein LOC113495624 isoform X2 n=1 Tax=Trichoplusia ni TaxID=7111 RepID=A0A7E5VPM5_TRINI|nr:uncharacterized protein LOC113495624 isoform X2 [Trichoplusia ni]
MDRYDKVITEINVRTHDLQIKSIQDVLILAKQKNKTNDHAFWNKIAELLSVHLKTGLQQFDDQLLCATCFYTVLTYSDQQDAYLSKLLQMINKELFKKNNQEKSTETSHVVSLVYGIFQSTFLIQKTHNDVSIVASVLKSTFDLLLAMGYEYSQYTFISFKTMKLYKKVCNSELHDCIFHKENQIKLINFINHNWENPVTGIRDLNRSLFQTLIATLHKDDYDTILKEIDGFYWNKAKYLMLSEIIEYNSGKVMSLMLEYKWVDGLIHSLHKPGLVSAGADMYYAVLKYTNFEKDWCKIFLKPVIKILNGPRTKTIENFNNFWCLPTLKKFSTLSKIILEELEDMEQTELNLFSKLCILKQANKLGIIEKQLTSTSDYKETENAVMNGINHCYSYIRMLAFDIICVSPRKLVPSKLEYDLILDFLYNNINSDCTVLRLSMLNSLNKFLTQLHSTFINVMIKDERTEDLQLLLEFCTKYQHFIVNSINVNGNYQRKITCVKLCHTLITCLTEIIKKKSNRSKTSVTLIKYVKDKGCWLLATEEFVLKLVSLLRDPTDDLRENVIKLLLNHYSVELREPSIIKVLVNEALNSMKSKFFYEICCSQSMFKLLSNLILKDKQPVGDYKSVEDIFNLTYNELLNEHREKTNIMQSIETGKQLHSMMSILLVVLETCISNSYQIDIQKIMPEFLEVLESVSNQFRWEEESSTSSDFSKMNDMVENIIVNYGYNYSDEQDQTKISGLHQIVLNCLWLNVKTTCDLASILVQYNVNNVEMSERCLNIITHVLETSRHKGAIESAGAALGRGIQFLTLLPSENKVSGVPFSLLKCKLNELISETNKMASITRRGAGLSIMVHRIVSHDMKKGKPLFHYFINTLLQICNNKIHSPNDENEANQVDLPKAIYIHFMTRIVIDSSLASDMMFYFADLAELAFGNLTSRHWQIRNAALQLYGALIPKQIGEKKASGDDEETIATVACDELRTHSPKLWKNIMEQLTQSNETDKVQAHSNLVPILNLLANSAKRYSFSTDLTAQRISDDHLLRNLVILLSSPIHTVRRLTAKCIFNIYNFKDIFNVLHKEHSNVENFLHGALILLGLCHKYYSSNELYAENFTKLGQHFGNVLTSQNHSYLCKELFEKIYNSQMKIEDVRTTISEVNANAYFPGIHLWAENRLKIIISSSSWKSIPDLLTVVLQQSNYEKYCELILLKIESRDVIPEEVLLEIINILLTFEYKYSSSIIWKILFEISLITNISEFLDITELLEKLAKDESVYILRYIIPLVARNIKGTTDGNKLNVVKIIDKLSDFENSDVDMRYIAAISNNELANHFQDLPDSIKVTSIKCAVMLLQDEDEDVRNLNVNFYKQLSRQNSLLQPYICLNNILNRKFLHTIFTDSHSIHNLVTELLEVLQLNHSVDEYNPFSNDSKNIYLEPEILKQLTEKLTT